MSFSNILKNAQATNVKAKEKILATSPASIMTLSLENEPENMLIPAYSGEEEWTLSKKYKNTEDNEYGKKYLDDNCSLIDEKKNVTVDSSQINLTQETNSQYIPFIMPRYFDGIDLMEMELSIYYINADKAEGISEPINVYYNSTQIKFGWLLNEFATALKGKLTFEIHAFGTNPFGEDYFLKTKPNSQLEVLESLQGNGTIIYDETWITSFYSKVGEYIEEIKGIAGEIKESKELIQKAIQESIEEFQGYTKNQTDEFLNAKADKSTVESLQGSVSTLYESVEDNTIAIQNINNEETGILAQAKSHAETYAKGQDTIIDNKVTNLINYLGTLPEGVTSTNVVAYIQEVLLKYYTQEEINEKFDTFDISDQLGEIEGRVGTLEKDFANFDGLAGLEVLYDNDTNTLSFWNKEKNEKICEDIVLDVTNDITTALIPINEDLASIHENIDNLPTTLESDYYTKTVTDELLADKAEVSTVNDLQTEIGKKANQSDLDTVKSTADTNKTDIGTLSKTVEDLSDAISNIDTSPSLTYDIAYNDVENPEVGENGFVLYEIKNESQENEERTVKRKFIITGGSGGGSSSSLSISYVTKSPVITTVNDKVLITYNFSGTDSSGDIVSEGNYTWKIGSKIIATGIATNGENTFDATDFASTTSQKFTLYITDDNGSLATKSWTVQQVDVRLESTFRDADAYTGEVSFNYTPYGAIEKEIHFVLDGEELGTETTSVSGVPKSYNIPAQTYGSHLLEVYMTAEINGQIVGLEKIIDEESGEVIGYNHTIKIVKDILWCDPTSSIPLIGCATPTINAMQYNTVNIKYAVLDPNTENPKVTWYIGEDIISEETLTEKDKDGYYTFSYKANDYGTFVLKVVCGEAEPKIITINVEKLNINVAPVTAGLAFDFNPVGYSNSSANRLWSHKDVTMTVSDNFDWVNGGYQIDENGDKYFCVKAGTNAIINYNLFADDPKKNGKEFKIIFRTKNIRKRNTSFLTCMDDNIGLDMKIENATLYNSGGLLRSDYCEDTIIEYEFNINKYTDMMIVMSYEDGTPGKPCEYTETSSFKHTQAQPITIGSVDCDIHIYRMKAYSMSLTDTDIKNNFIADARNADEMIARYNRNQIYNNDGKLISTVKNGDFNVDALMKAAPDLRYIFLEVPRFTFDKDDRVDDCTVYFKYPNGTRPHDNWTCTGVRHRGQGTSSNDYGYSGRNIDLCMDRKNSLFTWTDEEGIERTSTTITLTDTSVPTDYLNIKVNIASSENANNAEMARRFNEFQPFLRYARKKDSKVKDTMEFYNCVVFIREASTDSSKYPHQEFNDTNWHFYAIGNVGDSKKTDDTRVNNANDPKEHVIEIADADKPLCGFQTGKENNELCSVDEWKAGNTAYDILHSTEYVYDEGEFESFGGTTFEFRYEMDGITEEQREVNINTWRDLYKFIVTSTDEEFYAHLKDYFVIDSALYFYLFTERYTMVDNRAKNSFWHYGKVYISNAEAIQLGNEEASYYIIDDDAAAINDGYRYDLTFGYDFDTCLGIDNTGDYVFSYGKEDNDYYVDGNPASGYVFRVAYSTFFCRLRDLFPAEMQYMYKDREAKNAWSADSLIAQWDNSQVKFPEELWRLDYERKYYRTYLGLSIDNSIAKGKAETFLIGKFFGRKKYARRQFEINQENYFATKYFGNKIIENRFYIRGNVPIGSSIKQNYSLTLVPYSDMYVCMQYNSKGTPIHQKVKAGQVCTFENNSESVDFIYVYAASYIQEVGDLSRCYVGDNDFSKAIRLQKLVIGSTEEGYENTFMENVLVKNNPLLEHLDIRNVSGINSVIDVSSCSNLKELYAEGTNATGVIFANGGLLETAHLPSIKSLSMKNLNYIKDFVVDNYDNLDTLTVENTPGINTYEIINDAPMLKILRLTGINWDKTYQIKDSTIFNRLLTIRGTDSSGVTETDISVLSGIANVAQIGEQDLLTYKKVWSDLTIIPETVIPQFTVTFKNEDGTVLNIQSIEQFKDAVDPITREENPIEIPKKKKDIQYEYTFAGWDKSLTNITSDRIITATYSKALRQYTARYVSNGITVKEITGYYGDNIIYDTIPTYTNGEPHKFLLFNRWDKSGFLTNGFDDDGVKEIKAIFDEYNPSDYSLIGKELEDMSPVEIYAMNQLGLAQSVITDKDSYTFKLGHDFNYDDVTSVEIIGKNSTFGEKYKDTVIFDGTNYFDTGIQLFDEDKDFVLAIDYKFTKDTSDSVLAHCYRKGGFDDGFMLKYSNKAQLQWDNNTFDLSSVNEREMVIIRHKKGDPNLYVYCSNLSQDDISSYRLPGEEFTSTNTLVFGCEKSSATNFRNYATGEIHWAKLWYADLGEDICKQLAAWTHESITLEACGFNRYYLSDDPDNMCSFSMLASHLLDRTAKWNNSGTNVGGWANSDLNKYLNNRLYKAMPVQIKSLLKKVKIASTIGNKSLKISYSDCYIAIPAVIEVDESKQDKKYEDTNGNVSYPYKNEGESIKFINEVEVTPKRSFLNGEFNDYWLRSPSVGFSSYVWRVEEDGTTEEITSTNSKLGILILLSF